MVAATRKSEAKLVLKRCAIDHIITKDLAMTLLVQNLDIQYTVGIATGVPVTFISVGERTKDGALDGFLDIINFLLGQSAPPQVLTTSYGQNEDNISASLAKYDCTLHC